MAMSRPFSRPVLLAIILLALAGCPAALGRGGGYVSQTCRNGETCEGSCCRPTFSEVNYCGAPCIGAASLCCPGGDCVTSPTDCSCSTDSDCMSGYCCNANTNLCTKSPFQNGVQVCPDCNAFADQGLRCPTSSSICCPAGGCVSKITSCTCPGSAWYNPNNECLYSTCCSTSGTCTSSVFASNHVQACSNCNYLAAQGMACPKTASVCCAVNGNCASTGAACACNSNYDCPQRFCCAGDRKCSKSVFVNGTQVCADCNQLASQGMACPISFPICCRRGQCAKRTTDCACLSDSDCPLNTCCNTAAGKCSSKVIVNGAQVCGNCRFLAQQNLTCPVGTSTCCSNGKCASSISACNCTQAPDCPFGSCCGYSGKCSPSLLLPNGTQACSCNLLYSSGFSCASINKTTCCSTGVCAVSQDVCNAAICASDQRPGFGSSQCNNFVTQPVVTPPGFSFLSASITSASVADCSGIGEDQVLGSGSYVRLCVRSEVDVEKISWQVEAEDADTIVLEPEDKPESPDYGLPGGSCLAGSTSTQNGCIVSEIDTVPTIIIPKTNASALAYGHNVALDDASLAFGLNLTVGGKKRRFVFPKAAGGILAQLYPLRAPRSPVLYQTNVSSRIPPSTLRPISPLMGSTKNSVLFPVRVNTYCMNHGRAAPSSGSYTLYGVSTDTAFQMLLNYTRGKCLPTSGDYNVQAAVWNVGTTGLTAYDITYLTNLPSWNSPSCLYPSGLHPPLPSPPPSKAPSKSPPSSTAKSPSASPAKSPAKAPSPPASPAKPPAKVPSPLPASKSSPAAPTPSPKSAPKPAPAPKTVAGGPVTRRAVVRTFTSRTSSLSKHDAVKAWLASNT